MFRNIARRRRGQGFTEYALLLAMLCGVLVLILPIIPVTISVITSTVDSTIGSSIGPGGVGNPVVPPALLPTLTWSCAQTGNGDSCSSDNRLMAVGHEWQITVNLQHNCVPSMFISCANPANVFSLTEAVSSNPVLLNNSSCLVNGCSGAIPSNQWLSSNVAGFSYYLRSGEPTTYIGYSYDGFSNETDSAGNISVRLRANAAHEDVWVVTAADLGICSASSCPTPPDTTPTPTPSPTPPPGGYPASGLLTGIRYQGINAPYAEDLTITVNLNAVPDGQGLWYYCHGFGSYANGIRLTNPAPVIGTNTWVVPAMYVNPNQADCWFQPYSSDFNAWDAAFVSGSWSQGGG